MQNYIEQKFRELGINPDTANYVFFWSAQPKVHGVVDESCCCQWWTEHFVFDGVRFRTAEHAMMYSKAKLFNAPHIMKQVLEVYHPRDAKRLGRQVKTFNKQVWERHDYDIVKNISIQKFTQLKRLNQWLLGHPDNTIFVEASPYDEIWGIQLANDGKVDLTNYRNWKGLNKLGFALTEVFQQLQKSS